MMDLPDEKEDMITVTCITQFADELLEFICISPTLNYKDILNLSQTCRRFFAITKSNEIWRQKLLSTWEKWPYSNDRDDTMLERFKERICLQRYLKKKIRSVANKAHDFDEVPYSMIQEFDEIYFTEEQKLPVVLDILYTYANQSDHNGDINLMYYARKVYKYVYHQKLKKSWINLLNSRDDDVKDLEKGASLIAKWCNHNLRLSGKDISGKIDGITAFVKQKLPEESKCNSVPLSYYQANQIIKTINEVLYKDLQFKGNSRSYYDLKNSFIHQVLERKLGIPITLSVLYIAIARRLGMDVQGVNYPGHFLIKIMVEKSGKNIPMYIDAFNGGLFLDEDQCAIQFRGRDVDKFYWPKEYQFQIANKRKIFIRIVANIINILKENTIMDSRNLSSLRTAHELMLLLNPEDEENKLLLSKIYLHQGINLEEVASTLRGMFSSTENNPSFLLDTFLKNTAESQGQESVVIPKYRSHPDNKEVMYRIGMLMKHKRYNYYCVIYGWDPDCKMDNAWQAQMGVHRLKDQDKQPFYHVLAHDASSRYAAQESIEPSSILKPIFHPEVGKYFKTFNGTFYISTDKLGECYPEDQPIPEDENTGKSNDEAAEKSICEDE